LSSTRDSHEGLRELTFETQGVRLNYALGPETGPPLVLLHGLGRSWHVFLPLIPALSLRWQIYAVDLRGHGKSSHVARGYHGPEYSSDISAFLRERIGHPAILFGHSLGAMISMWVAAAAPELVRALILGDNMILSSTLPTGYASLFSALRDLVCKGGTVEELAQGLAKVRIRVPGIDEAVDLGELPGNDEAYLRSWARYLQQVDPVAYEMTLDGSSVQGWDGEAMLKQIQCPTLLLQANPSLGGMMSDHDVNRACALLARPVRVKCPTLGHALFIQNPEPVLRAVTNFLESLDF
jgi:pimeloyl-ACP methyl ester carboxylesterase